MKIKVAVLLFGILWLQCKSRQAGPEAESSLENTYWKLVEAGDKVIETPPNAREVYMILTREGDKHMLKGHAGCNGLGGDYMVDGKSVKFQPITTRMFCEEQMDVENIFTRMLSVADSYRIEGKTLSLYDGTDLLGKLEAKSPK